MIVALLILLAVTCLTAAWRATVRELESRPEWGPTRLPRATLLSLVLLSSSCGPSWYPEDSVWRPGDPPLEIWAESDAVWRNVRVACAAWQATGLTCVRTGDPDALVRVTGADLGGDLDGAAWRGGTAMIDRWAVGRAEGDAIAAHEIGHLLGVWDHLPEPWALMADRPLTLRGPEPSDADLQAVFDGWAVE